MVKIVAVLCAVIALPLSAQEQDKGTQLTHKEVTERPRIVGIDLTTGADQSAQPAVNQEEELKKALAAGKPKKKKGNKKKNVKQM